MSLAAGDHHVAGARHLAGRQDRLTTVWNAEEVNALPSSNLLSGCGSGCQDLLQALRPRVLSSENDHVGQLPGDPAHHRALLTIAQPGTAKDHDHAAFHHGSRRPQGLLQRVRCVSEVHDRQEVLSGLYPLHPSRHRSNRCDPCSNGCGWHLQCDSHGRGCQDVRDVEGSHQRCLYRDLLRRQPQREVGGISGEGHLTHRDVARPGQGVGDLAIGMEWTEIAVGIVICVQDRHFGHAGLAVEAGQVPKQTGLGLLVGGQRPVEIQMLVGDVGDRCYVEVGAGDPLLSQTVRGDLQHNVAGPSLHHPPQVPLHIRGIGGGGVQTRIHLLVADAGTDGGDHAGIEARGLEDRVDQRRGGRLAVGTRHADHRHPARREALPRSTEVPPGLPGVGHAHVGEGAPRQVRQVLGGSLSDDSHCPLGQCRGDESMPVDLNTRNGDKQLARPDAAGIGTDASHIRYRSHPALDHRQSLEKLVQSPHHRIIKHPDLEGRPAAFEVWAYPQVAPA